MKLVFVIKNRDNTPFMVVSTTPEGSTFKPMSAGAKELASMLKQEYGKSQITKPELVQTMDSSKIVEGPSPASSITREKVLSLVHSQPIMPEEVFLPVMSISEVLISNFSTKEYKNVITYKASSFISDQTQSSTNFEVKAVRALWDPSLSIPGTNRRGGWRCPVGTRYGGQITDRFGRSCGWGVSRRIANQIADIGERLELRDDGKRKRRLDRRNARMMRRLGGVPEAGRIEGGLRGIAERLDGGVVPDVQPPKKRIRDRLIEIGDEIGDELRPGSILDRVVNPGDLRQRRRRRVAPKPSPKTPSVREPQNRRRDTIPETAPKPKPRPRRKKPAVLPNNENQPVRPTPRAPRPQVVPQPENVDALTAREASDANLSEDFRPYVLRKYNEYAQRVRKIREGGGNAGMLTRREWYAINKNNLRDAWKDVHGRSAPRDFEPPTPQARRPRNNRARRRKATTESAGRSASRKPTPDDVPEPAPARPVRPARRPRRQPDGRGFVTPGDGRNPIPAANANSRILKIGEILGSDFDIDLPYEQKFGANAPNVFPIERDRRGQVVWNSDVLRAFNLADLKIDQLNLRDTHVAIYLQNNVYIVSKTDAKNIEDAWRNNSRDGNALGYRDVKFPIVEPKPRTSTSRTRTSFPTPSEAQNFWDDIDADLSITSPKPATPDAQNVPSPSSTSRRSGRKRQLPQLNRLMDRHETGLPILQNGKFDEVPVGNKNIRTKAQALAHQGPLTDIPDKFLEAVVKKRSDVITVQGQPQSNSGLAKAMFGTNGATTPEQRRALNDTIKRIKKSRTKGAGELIDGDKETLKKLKQSGVEYISFNAGTGGANPSFHLFIGDDGNLDGRGYLLKPKDGVFGNGANHAELLGAAIAKQMGFAHGQGRIIPGANIKVLLELGPNFAGGVAENVGAIAQGADAVKDKESRLGGALINGIMGTVDRHAGNGMVFDGNGALPIDFGRAFYADTDTPTKLFQYFRSEYSGIDNKPLQGYKTKYQEEIRAGKTPQEAKDALRTELKQTLEQWRDGIKEIIENGVVDNLDARFVNNRDVGRARNAISARKGTVQNRINIMASDEFVDLLMGVVTA